MQSSRRTDWVAPQQFAPASETAWFAVRVKSNFERSVADALCHRGLEEFLPTYRVRRSRAGHPRDVELPLFPGYLFSRFDVNRRMIVLTVPGLLHIVGASRVPLPVEPQELAAVRTVVASQRQLQPWPFLRTGERVRIDRGPLRGLEGILISTKGVSRIVVSVTLLQRSVAVDLDRDSAKPVTEQILLHPVLGAAR